MYSVEGNVIVKSGEEFVPSDNEEREQEVSVGSEQKGLKGSIAEKNEVVETLQNQGRGESTAETDNAIPTAEEVEENVTEGERDNAIPAADKENVTEGERGNEVAERNEKNNRVVLKKDEKIRFKNEGV